MTPLIRLKMLREQRGLSLRQLAKIAEVHYVSLARLEAGKFDPRLSTLRKLARTFNATITELVGDKRPKKGGR